MDTGKNELSPEMIEAIRKVVKEEIGNELSEDYLFSEDYLLRLTSRLLRGTIVTDPVDRIMRLEREVTRHVIHEHINELPTIYKNSDVSGHVTRVTRDENGIALKIKLTDKGKETVDDITAAEQLYWNIYDARHKEED